jgi:hypothetical protein
VFIVLGIYKFVGNISVVGSIEKFQVPNYYFGGLFGTKGSSGFHALVSYDTVARYFMCCHSNQGYLKDY